MRRRCPQKITKTDRHIGSQPKMIDGSESSDIVAMTCNDIEDVIVVHLRAFPGFFLSQLGPAVLRVLYGELLRDGTGICFICRSNGRIIGFVVGTADPRAFYMRLLRKRCLRLGISFFGAIVRIPGAAPRLLNAFRRTRAEIHDAGCGLLMSIAIDPEFQGIGRGKALACHFLRACRDRGLSAVHLFTDRMQNNDVNRFYCSLGFEVSQVITSDHGRLMNDYRIILST